MNWACASCGGENPDGMRFCGHCGAPAGGPPAPESSVLPPTLTPDRAAETEPDALRSFVTGQVADRLIESGGELTEERRLVTALFADLSGFTSLSERLDAEELLEVIDPIIRALTNIVGRYEGFVEKFAGDALLALFGAPVAHEDDAARALLVAGEMHRELANLRQKLGDEARDLTLHIGINSGHGVARLIGSAVRMDYAVLGDSVILAQRLESAAPPGETYIGEATYRLVRERFELEPVGPLTLKGKSGPVPAWRLMGETAAAERSAIGQRHATPLIGRTEETNAVSAVLEGLATGTGGLVSLIGEPGVGKSRLTDEARATASMLGIRWLEARALSYGAGLPYWPYLDLVRRLAGFGVEDAAAECTVRLREAMVADGADAGLPFLGHLLSLPDTDPDDAVSRLEPEAFRRGLHDAFVAWLKAMAQRQPLVLALEDCHWIDASSAALTLDLARACHDERQLIYLTGRPIEGGLVDEVSGADLPVALALHLQPLDSQGVNELAEYLVGGTPPAGLLAALYDRGGGNPFFVQETVRSLLDTGVLMPTAGGWDLRAGWDASAVSETIEGVLAARIDALPSRAARLLGVASVIGRRVRMPLLRAVAVSPDADAAVALLVDSGFLDRSSQPGDDTVVFHHALMQDVAYGRLLRRRRRDLHRRTADEAERLWGAGDDLVDLLARHLYLGEAGTKAVAYLVRAGERARSLFANEEALLHFTRAAELVRAARDDPEVTGQLHELLLTLADLHELRGEYEQARSIYEEVRAATGDIRAWRGIAATLRSRGAYADALETIEQAFATPGLADSDPRPLWLERGWSLSAAGSLPAAVAAYQAGLDADGAAHDVVTGQLLVELARAEATEGDFRPAAEHAEQARLILEKHGDLRVLATALRVLGGVQDDLGDYAGAERTLRRALNIAERVGKAEEIGHSLVNLAIVQRNRGDLEAAISGYRRAIDEYERIGHAAGRTIAYANLGEALVRAGNLQEAEHLSVRAGEMARSIGHVILQGQSLENLAEIRMKQERYADALDFAQEAAVLFGDAGVVHIEAECWRLASEAAEKLGDVERASELANRASSLVATQA